MRIDLDTFFIIFATILVFYMPLHLDGFQIAKHLFYFIFKGAWQIFLIRKIIFIDESSFGYKDKKKKQQQAKRASNECSQWHFKN